DESATLVAWSVAAGMRVASGQPIAQIETSKAVVDLPPPAGGFLRPRVRAGEDVPIGGVLGWVVAEEGAATLEAIAAPEPGRDALAPTRPPATAAAEPASAPTSTTDAPPGPVAVTGVATRTERLARAKRVEAKSLRAGAAATLPSAVTVACPTRGFRDAVARQ